MIATALRIPSEGSRFEVGEDKTVFEVTKERGRLLWAKSVINTGVTFDGKIMNELQNFKINGVKYGLESMKIKKGFIFITIIAGKVNRIQKTPVAKESDVKDIQNTAENI